MDFSLTDDQTELVNLFDGMFKREVPATRVRESEPTGFDRSLWELVSGAGAVGVAIPESLGGAGYGLLEAALIAERAGRVLAPVPLVDAICAARLLASVVADDSPVDVSPFVDGSRIATVALRRVSGEVARLVPSGAVADLVVVNDGQSLLAIEDHPRTPVHDLGSAPTADLMVSQDRDQRVIAGGERAERLWDDARRDWRCLMAATLVGAASAALDIAVAYVSEREQFGQPIGAFQSIAHGLADAATDIDGARLLAYEAAWAVDEGAPEARALAGMALSFATEIANGVAIKALHYHGGYGFMLEYDIQLYYRRIRSWPMAIGGGDDELGLLADELYGPVKEQH
jgi:alkylation response protein AidB-like acyl-CoA dehydrogenase